MEEIICDICNSSIKRKSIENILFTNSKFIYPHQRAEQYYAMFCKQTSKNESNLGKQLIDAYYIATDILIDSSESIYIAFNLSVFFPGANDIVAFLVGLKANNAEKYILPEIPILLQNL